MSLTAPERETVITFSDDSNTATIHTQQRRIITKLKNNPAVIQVDDLTFDGTAGAGFEIPAGFITFAARSARAANSSATEKAEKVRLLQQAREAA